MSSNHIPRLPQGVKSGDKATCMYHVYDISCSLCTRSTAFVETALQMPLQPPVVYHLLQNVYSVFEQGKLKG